MEAATTDNRTDGLRKAGIWVLVSFLILGLVGVLAFEILVGTTSSHAFGGPCTQSPGLSQVRAHDLVPTPSELGRVVVARRWFRPISYRFESDSGESFSMKPGRDGIPSTCGG